MAVESTPERSFSDLFRSSRAAEATTGCGRPRRDAASSSWPAASSRSAAWDRRGRRRRRRASCPPRRRGHAGWRRPGANGWSSPNGCGARARPRDRPARRRRSGRRAPPIRRAGPRAADCRQRTCALVGSNSRTREKLAREAGGELPVLALDVMDDGRARPGEQRRHDQADALAADRVGAKQSTCSGPSWRR